MNLLELRFGFHRKEADWHIDLVMHTKRGSVVYLRQGGYAFIGVSSFVCLQYYWKTKQPIFTTFGGNFGPWFTEESTRFLCNRYVRVMVTVRWRPHDARHVLPSDCSTVRISLDQRPF